MSQVIDKAVAWLIDLANDNSHGYSQVNRFGPDYDCSSSTIQAYRVGGLQLKGATYTGDMKNAFVKEGFQAIRYSKNIVPQKGDVFLNEVHHVVVYIGEGKVVTASSSETGGKTGRTGDQTGKEIYIRDFYTPKNYSWEWVLRYVGDDPVTTGNPYPMPTTTITRGSIGPSCKWVQWELNQAGANPKLDEDGEIGSKSYEMIKAFQRAVGIEVDGKCGPQTRRKLIENTTKVINTTTEKPKNPYTRPTRLLSRGCRGQDVCYVQWYLNQKGYNLSMDGSFGKLTENAVYDFQKKAFPNQPSEWDKIVGQKTLKALES